MESLEEWVGLKIFSVVFAVIVALLTWLMGGDPFNPDEFLRLDLNAKPANPTEEQDDSDFTGKT